MWTSSARAHDRKRAAFAGDQAYPAKAGAWIGQTLKQALQPGHSDVLARLMDSSDMEAAGTRQSSPVAGVARVRRVVDQYHVVIDESGMR
jgi:hypothetical protein